MYKLTLFLGLFGGILISFAAPIQSSFRKPHTQNLLQDELPNFKWMESVDDGQILAAISSYGALTSGENGEYDTNDYSGRMLTSNQDDKKGKENGENDIDDYSGRMITSSQDEIKINTYSTAYGNGKGKENGEYDEISGYDKIFKNNGGETGEGY